MWVVAHREHEVIERCIEEVGMVRFLSRSRSEVGIYVKQVLGIC